MNRKMYLGVAAEVSAVASAWLLAGAAVAVELAGADPLAGVLHAA